MFTFKKMLVILLVAVLLRGCLPSAGPIPDGTGEVNTSEVTQEPEKTAVAPESVQPTVARAVITGEPTAVKPAPQPTAASDYPRAKIESFYRWYFGQPRGEILSKRTYNDNPDLSDIFKSDLNYLLDSFKDRSGYDPFTCAQNNLPSLNITQMFVSGGEGYALAEVIIDMQVRHYFVVAVGKGEGTWKIEGIFCSTEPKTAAIAFYTWYLGYMFGDVDVENGAEILHNPIAEKAYRHSFLMTDAFISKIDAELEAMQTSGGTADPILDSQILPRRFTVQPGNVDNTAVVRLDYDARTARYHNLTLANSISGWKVNDIQHVEVPHFDPFAHPEVDTSGWEEYKDEDYDFSLRYPPGWSVKAANQSDQPADDPVARRSFFHAPGLDPTLPVMWLDVFEGSEEQLIQYYVTESHQVEVLNGVTLWIDRETCSTRYVFRHPERENIWLIIGDSCPSMPGREAYAEKLDPVIAPLVRTVTFP